jgi:uncharacterized protein YbgA (DUF1722 family)
MRLIGEPEAPRLIAPRSGTDHTARMQEWAEQRLDALAALGLHGFIFKKGSPSSGRFRVRVYRENGMPAGTGVGMFARAFVDRFPYLPTEEEGRLNDMPLRENFIERIFVMCRWRQLLEDNPTAGGLVRFHTAMKLTLMAHSPQHYRRLGKLVADAGNRPWSHLQQAYIEELMEGLKVLATPGKHANVMQHLMGFLKEKLVSEDKQELLDLIDQYRRGYLPLIVPVTLLKHHLRRHSTPPWVEQQFYLHPYPRELQLRNHV